jgi:hypothetical protein
MKYQYTPGRAESGGFLNASFRSPAIDIPPVCEYIDDTVAKNRTMRRKRQAAPHVEKPDEIIFFKYIIDLAPINLYPASIVQKKEVTHQYPCALTLGERFNMLALNHAGSGGILLNQVGEFNGPWTVKPDHSGLRTGAGYNRVRAEGQSIDALCDCTEFYRQPRVTVS